MTTQLLFGEIFTILQVSENQKWLEIHIFHDNYVGWIDILQCTFVSARYFIKYVKSIPYHKIVLGWTGGIEEKSTKKSYYQEETMVMQGSIIPFTVPHKDASYENFKIEKHTYSCCGLSFHYGIDKKTKKFIINEIVENACLYLNAPYLWGGRSIFGIDCSGLIQQVFRFVGYHLPRDAYQQAEEGKLVKFDAKKQGDLAFFVRENKIIHVGIVLEDNKIIHARGQVRIDILTPTGILDENTNEYSHYLAFLKRIL